MKLFNFFCILAVSLVSANLLADIEISGIVKSGTNEKFKRADVVISASYSTICSNDGAYKIVIPNSQNFIQLCFSAVNHSTLKYEISCLPNTKYEINATLQPLFFKGLSDSIFVCGDFNGYDLYENLIPMAIDMYDFTYSAVINKTTDTIGYQIVIQFNNGGEQQRRSINGQNATFFKPDSSYGYISYIVNQDDKAAVWFNPTALHIHYGNFNVSSPNPAIKEVLSISDTILRYRTDSNEAMFFAMKADAIREKVLPDKIYDSMKLSVSTKIEKLFNAAKYAETKNYLADEYIETIFRGQTLPANKKSINKTIIDYYLNNIDLSSNIFSRQRHIIPALAADSKLNGQSLFGNPLLSKYCNKNKDSKLDKFYSDLVEFAMRMQDTANAKKYLALLKNEYPLSDAINYFDNSYNLDKTKKILVDSTIPDFELPNMGAHDVHNSTISTQKLRGKYVLINVWCLGCPSCLAEIPNFEKNYNKFKDRNFTIYSICFDAAERVIEYRKNLEHTMLWLHSVAKGGWKNPVIQLLETIGVPHTILIDPDGKIIALRGLRGDSLEKTLEKYLK